MGAGRPPLVFRRMLPLLPLLLSTSPQAAAQRIPCRSLMPVRLPAQQQHSPAHGTSTPALCCCCTALRSPVKARAASPSSSTHRHQVLQHLRCFPASCQAAAQHNLACRTPKVTAQAVQHHLYTHRHQVFQHQRLVARRPPVAMLQRILKALLRLLLHVHGAGHWVASDSGRNHVHQVMGMDAPPSSLYSRWAREGR